MQEKLTRCLVSDAQQSRAIAELLGQPAPEDKKEGDWMLSFDDQQSYALLLDIDGNSWSSR